MICYAMLHDTLCDGHAGCTQMSNMKTGSWTAACSNDPDPANSMLALYMYSHVLVMFMTGLRLDSFELSLTGLRLDSSG